MNLSAQRRIAANILGVGQNKVWIDPDATDDVALSLTRDDISKLIADGVIRSRQNIGISRGRKTQNFQQRKLGRRKGYGRRKGRKGSRQGPTHSWEAHIRAQRRFLRGLRDNEAITPTQYRQLYVKSKGGAYRGISHLKHTIEESGMLKKPKRRRR